MKRIVSISTLAVVLLFSLLLTACSNHDEIYNDAKALTGGDSYTEIKSSKFAKGNEVTYKCGSLSGLVTLYELKAADKTAITVTGTLGIGEGRGKIIVTGPDGFIEVVQEVTVGQEETFTATVMVDSGSYKVRVVGQSAKDIHAEIAITT